MIIVDTTVWIDYLRGVMTPETNWLELELSRQPIGLTDLILCEVLQGIQAEAQFEATRRELLKCEVFTMGGISFAITAARNYQRLRSGGYTIRRTVDCWIATFCIHNGHSLLHNDRDFDPFEQILNLQVIHPQ